MVYLVLVVTLLCLHVFTRFFFIITMVKFASIFALLVSGTSAFVSQNNAAIKSSSALNAAEGVWDPMVRWQRTDQAWWYHRGTLHMVMYPTILLGLQSYSGGAGK
jgi:hypothetical protein